MGGQRDKPGAAAAHPLPPVNERGLHRLTFRVKPPQQMPVLVADSHNARHPRGSVGGDQHQARPMRAEAGRPDQADVLESVHDVVRGLGPDA